MSRSLRELIGVAGRLQERRLWPFEGAVTVSKLLEGSVLGRHADILHGRSVLIATANQFMAACVLVELDGIVARLILCPPDLSPEHVPSIVASAGIDTIISDLETIRAAAPGLEFIEPSGLEPRSGAAQMHDQETEWVLLTSGTSGVPKLVVHNLGTLTGAIASGSGPDNPPVWGTFYDVRRYGGLQILLRALLGNGSFVMSDARESVHDYLKRAGELGLSHISGTPTHWRNVLMSPDARRIAPRYIRLSGEIADQAILDRLKIFYPNAAVGHAFASTEAGVAFEVWDGLTGFPASLIGREGGTVELRIIHGSLHIRSARTARHFVDRHTSLVDEDGFVDTGDVVEQRGDRFYFVGRRGGIVNVGGLKVHPEEVEAVINSHPSVQISLVRARKNPITGSVLVADALLRSQPDDPAASELLKGEIMMVCRRRLAPHKVPVTIRFVPNLDVAASGKLVRSVV